MKRGDVFWADLIPRSGSGQSGRRPVVIVSHNGFNQSPNWHSIIVVPISTSELQGRRGPTVVALPKGAASLPRSSFVLGHQVTTLDRSKLTERLGALSAATMEKIADALKAAMDID